MLERILGDPVTHEPRAALPIVDGVPCAIVPDEEVVRRHGRRALAAWRAVQDECERSVAEVGPTGNFSHDEWRPAIEAAERFVATAPRAALVLDVGCGSLRMPAYLNTIVSAWHCDIVGVDPLRGEERDFHFVQALGDFLPFRRAVVDASLFVSSLDHMISPLCALEGVRDVLVPGGWLLVEETVRPPDRAYRRWRLRSLAGPTRYNAFHNHAFTRAACGRSWSGQGSRSSN